MNEAFFKIGYGLYVVTTNDGVRDNGMICNTVMQVAGEPAKIAISINKANYTHEIAKKTGKMNVCTISESAAFSLFQRFGFKSGRDADKFEGVAFDRSPNGLAVLKDGCNSYFSLEVESYVDLGSHGMFVCTVPDAKVLSGEPTMTYAFYHANVKPKPAAKPKAKGFVCTICGYIYEGDELPADFICPLCKHPASDFKRLE